MTLWLFTQSIEQSGPDLSLIFLSPLSITYPKSGEISGPLLKLFPLPIMLCLQLYCCQNPNHALENVLPTTLFINFHCILSHWVMITSCHFSFHNYNINFKDRDHVSINLISPMPTEKLNKYLFHYWMNEVTLLGEPELNFLRVAVAFTICILLCLIWNMSVPLLSNDYQINHESVHIKS